MRICDLICEARGDLLTYLTKMYQRGEGNIRFRGYVEAVGEKEFARIIDQIEMFSDQMTIRRIMNKPSTVIQVIEAMSKVRDLPSVGMSGVRNTGRSLADSGSPLVGDDGLPPNYLFRYISGEEYQSIKYTGHMSPSEFYGRIHASYRPETRYKVSGGVLISIRYDRSDGWSSKQAGDNVYAVTGSRVSSDKIKIVK